MRVFKSFMAGLFSFVFGALLVITICVFSVSGFATKDNIVNNMQKTNVLKEVKKIRNSGSAEGNSGIAQVVDEMYSLASQFSVSEDVVDEIIDSKITKKIIGDAVGNLTDYIINGKEAKVLSEDDIYNLISDNLDDILDENDLSIDEGQKEKFLREVEKQLPDIVNIIPTSSDIIKSSYGDNVEIMQLIFSNNTKIILVVSLIVSLAIVIIIKRKEFEWATNIGVALLISGLVTIGIALLMPGLLVDMMAQADLSMFTSPLIDYITNPILYSGIGSLVIAVILFIFYKIMEKRLEKN